MIGTSAAAGNSSSLAPDAPDDQRVQRTANGSALLSTRKPASRHLARVLNALKASSDIEYGRAGAGQDGGRVRD